MGGPAALGCRVQRPPFFFSAPRPRPLAFLPQVHYTDPCARSVPHREALTAAPQPLPLFLRDRTQLYPGPSPWA